MKRRFLIVCILMLLPLQAQAMGERPVIDPACFASETLRVEIGGEKIAFPRKMVSSVRGEDVVNPKDSRSDTISGGKACQKQNDKTWKVNYATLDILPNNCSLDDSQCGERRIYVDLFDLTLKITGALNSSVFPDTKIELLDECVPPIEPFSAWHAKVWSACDYIFEDKGIFFRIIFRGGVYPPEKIEETQALVLKTIRQYLIK